MPLTPTQIQQRRTLETQSCDGDLEVSLGLHPFERHHLVATYSRRLRDGFRKRLWWRCGSCSLRVEMVP